MVGRPTFFGQKQVTPWRVIVLSQKSTMLWSCMAFPLSCSSQVLWTLLHTPLSCSIFSTEQDLVLQQQISVLHHLPHPNILRRHPFDFDISNPKMYKLENALSGSLPGPQAAEQPSQKQFLVGKETIEAADPQPCWAEHQFNRIKLLISFAVCFSLVF